MAKTVWHSATYRPQYIVPSLNQVRCPRRAKTRPPLQVDMNRVHARYGTIRHGPPITSNPIQMAHTPQHNAVRGRSKPQAHAPAPLSLGPCMLDHSDGGPKKDVDTTMVVTLRNHSGKHSH